MNRIISRCSLKSIVYCALLSTLATVFFAGFHCINAAEDSNTAEKKVAGDYLVKDFGWCVLYCPKTCEPGKEFTIKMDLKNLKIISRNWEADKLAVHLFWGNGNKWGGYLAHFASAGVKKDGMISLKGKFKLKDEIKDKATSVYVKAVLTSDWSRQEENMAAELMGPPIKIVK